MTESGAVARRDAHMKNWVRVWNELWTVVDGLTDEERTELRNADGWTVKDHLAHLVAWKRTVVPFLDRQPRHETLGVPESVWKSGDYDAINAIVYELWKDLPFDRVKTELIEIQGILVNRFDALTDEDLRSDFGGTSLVDGMEHRTWGHDEDHLGYIRKIVGQSANR